MSAADDLEALGVRVRALDDMPVHTHPDVLEAVHRALVDELDALAGAGSVGARRPAS
jgi:hypothetical protein